MFKSLKFNGSSSHIYVLCIDDETFAVLSRLGPENVIPIKAEEIEDDMLLAIKEQRLLNEYCWTLKPFLIDHVFRKNWNLDYLTYLDGDICFFSDPKLIYENLGEAHILLTKHNFPDVHKGVAEVCGTYNSGYIIFKRSSISLEALKWWKKNCYEWCYDKAEDGKFGDQKYLDMMADITDGVRSLEVPGVNIAPWNEENYVFSLRDGELFVNDDRLICYHFSGLRLVGKDRYALVIGNKTTNPLIHTPYIYVLNDAINEVKDIVPDFEAYQIEEKFAESAMYFSAKDIGVLA